MRRLLVGVYRLLFRIAAPRDLRRDFGEQVDDVFREMLRAAEREGRLRLLSVWWREVRQLFGVVRSLSREPEPVLREEPGPWYRRALDQGRSDVRLAAVSLARRPVFSLAVLVTLGVGLGLTGAVYAGARASILAPLPVDRPDELLVVTGFVSTPEWTGRGGLTARELQAVGTGSRHFDGFAAFSLTGSVTHTADDGPSRLVVSFVGPAFFELLGARAFLGRAFGEPERESTDAPHAVLAHHAWRERFGADPDVVGRSIELAGVAYTVVGVMPEGFWGLDRFPRARDAWLPLGRAGDALGRNVVQSLGNAPFWGVGRLRAGVSADAALAEAVGRHRGFVEAHSLPSHRSVGTLTLREYYFGGAERPLAAVALGALVVLAICAVNLALLFALRVREREAELAVRSALGGSRVRVAQTLFAEAALLAIVGGVLGVLVARTALQLFLAGFGDSLLRFQEMEVGIGLGATVVAAALVLASFPTFAWLAFGGRAVSRMGERGVGDGDGGSAQWVVGLEAALTAVVVIAALLSGRSLVALQDVELGYDPRGLQSVRMSLTGSRHADAADRARFVRALEERMRARFGPDVGIMGPDMLGRSVNHLHLTPFGLDPAAEENLFRAQWISIAPGSLEALGIELVEGRDLAWSDQPGRRAVLVLSEAAAARLWPGESAVGKPVHVGGAPSPNAEVVGVVRSARHVSRYGGGFVIGDAYLPFPQSPTSEISLLYRSSRDASALSDVEQVVASIDDRVALFDALPMAARLRAEEGGLRLVLSLSLLYAAIALFLMLCGLVGVVATAVQRRRGELAVRKALGAERARLIWGLMRRIVAALVVGVAVGGALAAVATEPLSRVLFGLTNTDPATYALAGAGLLAVGLLAAWLPARRITGIPPAEVMRSV